MKYIFIVITLLPISVIAQQDSYLSLFRYNMSLVNPAFSGAEGKHVVSLASRNQWSETKSSPKTNAFSYSAAIGKNVGLGISVISDKIFIENQTTITTDFSYQLTLSNDTAIFLGIKAGGNSYSSDPTMLSGYNSEIDPLKSSLSSFNPNLGVGFLYQMSDFWISGSIPRLFNSKRDGEMQIQSRDRVHTYIAGEYVFSLNDKFALKLNLMYRKTKGIDAVTDVGLKGSYSNFFDLGFSFRTGSIFSSQAILNINENLELGYAYDTYGSDQLSGISLKAHEIFMRFIFSKTSKTPKVEVETSE
jgi:type IX secretion system PorP/SprF family membrane protein